ncbi:MAG: pyridoxal phosphate-dependent aminotransferase [Deltaproteobacteria bacterium]|nr:pyridoxal phosphate-dependent aminotransferase [Deltaproteobacteria bacterium]
MSNRRFPWDLTPTDFAREQETATLAGEPPLDLTVSNPPALGLGPGPEHFADLDPATLARYAPDPLGALPCREAVATYLAGHGADLGPEAILLTASTSEAYGWLFKVLAPPGSAVAIPRPSYPLFDFLTHLEGVLPVSYNLFHHERWQLDRGSLEEALAQGAKAVVVVQPSNPLGACLSAGDRDWLLERCGAAGAAVIADEVFLDYADASTEELQSLAHAEADARARASGVALFVLSGLSKVVAAPQVKLGWIALLGTVTAELRARLELVADTYLSVSAAAQLLGPRLLARGEALRAPIRERLQANLEQIDRAVASGAVLKRVSEPAGWSVVLRLPHPPEGERDWAGLLLREERLLTHPGHFYELDERHLVLSGLTEPAQLEEGLGRLLRRVEVGFEEG